MIPTTKTRRTVRALDQLAKRYWAEVDPLWELNDPPDFYTMLHEGLLSMGAQSAYEGGLLKELHTLGGIFKRSGWWPNATITDLK